MYEEHEDGSFTLHMCEWYEQGRRLVGEYETLGDGSGFAVTDEWSTCSKVVVNHPLTRPDGTVMPGISRLRRFDWRVGPDGGCAPTTMRYGRGNCASRRNMTGSTASSAPWAYWVMGNPSSTDSQGWDCRLPGDDGPSLHDVSGGCAFHVEERGRLPTGNGHRQTIPMTPTIHSGHAVAGLDLSRFVHPGIKK